MPGRPQLQALERRIAESGGDEAVFALIATGISVTKVGEHFGVSRHLLNDWRTNAGEERIKGWAAAMKDSADALVEEAVEILDNANTSSTAEVNKAGKRADIRKWLGQVRGVVERVEADDVAAAHHVVQADP